MTCLRNRTLTLLLWLLAASCSIVRIQGQPDDSQAGAAPILFEIVTGGTFRCVDSGARCSYVKAQYQRVFNTGGQESINGQENIWAANDPSSDQLTLEGCLEDNCYTECNANCTCTTLPDGEDCAVEETRAPTPSEPTPSPTAAACANVENNEFCAELMPVVPAGNQFDCYNFCGGEFLSTCNFGPSPQCGALTCDNSGEGKDGTVLGCTDADRADGGGGGGGGGESSGSDARYAFEIIAFSMFVGAICHMV